MNLSNCAALPDTLLESKRFGYERGAFTGAQKKIGGKFEQARGKVLFFRKIDDMPLARRSRLSHALEDGFDVMLKDRGGETSTTPVERLRMEYQFQLTC